MQRTLTAVRRLSRLMEKHSLPAHIFLILICILIFYPLSSLVLLSVKDVYQFDHNRWGITFPVHVENYRYALRRIYPYVLNSLIVSCTSILGVLVLSTTASYTFARFSFPGKELLYVLIIGLLMTPGILSLIPRYIAMLRLRMLNTYWALILPYIAGGQVFGIFLLRTFLASVNEELFDAARIDGASEMRILYKIAVPLAKPILSVLAIVILLETWNDIIWPFLVLNDVRLKTIAIGLWDFRGIYHTQWGLLFSGYVLASIPLVVLFLFTTRTFIAGLTSGALKM